MTLTPEDDTTKVITVENHTPLENGSRQTRVALFKTRTPSQSEITEKDTVVETTVLTPGGDRHTEQNKVTTRTKVTRHGSQYVRRDAVRTRTLASKDGREICQDMDVLVEKDSMSVTRGESSSETVKMRLMDKPNLMLEYSPQGTEDSGNKEEAMEDEGTSDLSPILSFSCT